MNDAILNAVVQAAELCRKVQDEFLKVSEKAGKEPVTIADYGSQAIICRAIRQHFPDDAVIAEENGHDFLELVPEPQREIIVRLIAVVLGITVSEAEVVAWLNHGYGVQAKYTWVIDPIDGTKGFIDFRHYAIAVGKLTDGQPLEGILCAPEYEIDGQTGVLFTAIDGQANLRLMSDLSPRPIHVSNHTIQDTVRLAEGLEPSHTDHERMAKVYEIAQINNPEPVRVDGQEKYGMVACGDADIYLRFPSSKGSSHRAWDHAAGVAIVLAAGGRATDIDGSPLIFSEGKKMPNQGMLVTNGQVHDAMLKAMTAVLS